MNTELITLEMNRFNNFNKYIFLLLLTISSSCNIPNDIGYVMNDDHYTTKVNNILTESFSGNFKMMQSLFHNDVIIKYLFKNYKKYYYPFNFLPVDFNIFSFYQITKK